MFDLQGLVVVMVAIGVISGLAVAGLIWLFVSFVHVTIQFG